MELQALYSVGFLFPCFSSSRFSNRTAFYLQRGMLVVPVIGVLSDRKAFNPSPNAAEVEEIFDAPLEICLKVLCSTYYTKINK